MSLNFNLSPTVAKGIRSMKAMSMKSMKKATHHDDDHYHAMKTKSMKAMRSMKAMEKK